MTDRRPPRRGPQRAPQGGGQRRAPREAPRPTARRVAFDVLRAVREDDAYANLLLPVRIRDAALDSADAALATELTYGTLRGRGTYDAIVTLAAKRPTDAIDPAVLDVLRLGAHQVLAMRIPDHAAVDESVRLARAVGATTATGFVNGVLRTITRTPEATWRERIAEAAPAEDDRIAALTSHPTWVVRAMRRALGAEGRADELDALLTADNATPRVTLVELPGTDGAVEGERTAYSPVGVRLEGGDPAAIPAVRAGTVRVQDEGSQLAALALSRATPVVAGERWLDLCAGPGGKAALLAAEAAASGAVLVANEVVPARAQLVARALAPFPGVEVRTGDGRELGDREPETYDRILLDAPCTGLGALRRRPEARWRKQPRDVAELSALQGELLASAAAALKPGGVLAYVTCSPHLAETRTVVEQAVKRGLVRTLDTPEVFARVAGADLELPTGEHEATSVQLWPHRHGTDAMFVQLLTTP